MCATAVSAVLEYACASAVSAVLEDAWLTQNTAGTAVAHAHPFSTAGTAVAHDAPMAVVQGGIIPPPHMLKDFTPNACICYVSHREGLKDGFLGVKTIVRSEYDGAGTGD
jgi:hypothetical protein